MPETIDAYDTVKQFLQDLDAGLTQPARAKEIRSELREVSARLERAKRFMPVAAGLSESVAALLKIVEGGRGLLGVAAVL